MVVKLTQSETSVDFEKANKQQPWKISNILVSLDDLTSIDVLGYLNPDILEWLDVSGINWLLWSEWLKFR